MKILKTSAFACALIASFQANSVLAKGSVVAKVGTLGAGLEYVHPITPKFAVSLGANGLSYDDTLNESDINYNADLNMSTISLLGDYHPTGNGFRISAGVMHNGNEFDLVGTPSGSETVDINGTTYTAADVGSLKATIGFESIAPYLGIGWGRAPKSGKGWGFDADLGVLFQGNPNTALSVTCGPSLTDAACTTLKNDAAAEEVSLKSDSEDFDLFPVLSIGVSYKF